MSRYTMVINNAQSRLAALSLVRAAPDGTRVEFKAVKRSLPQNARMWAMLSDISLQVKWCGEVLRPDDWKLIFLDALDRTQHIVPNLEGDGVVQLNRSSSDLSKQEMSDLMELVAAFGAEHGVTFNDPRD